MVLGRVKTAVVLAAVLFQSGCGSSPGVSSGTWPLEPSSAGPEIDQLARAACGNSFRSAGEPLLLTTAERRAEHASLYYAGDTYDLLVVAREASDGSMSCEAALGGTRQR
jgi:hypothetical protein